jgi:hypothetical protein
MALKIAPEPEHPGVAFNRIVRWPGRQDRGLLREEEGDADRNRHRDGCDRATQAQHPYAVERERKDHDDGSGDKEPYLCIAHDIVCPFLVDEPL